MKIFKFLFEMVFDFLDLLFDEKNETIYDDSLELFRKMYGRYGERTFEVFSAILQGGEIRGQSKFLELVEKLSQVIKEFLNRKIVIIGDKDTDGILSASIAYDAFRRLGAKDIEVFITNDRKEPIANALKNFDKGRVLLVMTDVGSGEMVDLLNSSTLPETPIAVIDHHPIKLNGNVNFNNKHILVNLNRDDSDDAFSELPGGALSLLVFTEVLRYLLGEEEARRFFEENLILGATTVVSDVAPFSGLNLALIHGAILRMSGKFTKPMLYPRDFFTFAAFSVSPIINSWSRLVLNRTGLFEIPEIMTEEKTVYIDRSIFGRSFYEAYRGFIDNALLRSKVKSLGNGGIYAFLPNIYSGVKGLIANLLLKDGIDFVVVVSQDPEGKIVGSVRSIYPVKGVFSVYDKFGEVGGHVQAFGFSLDMNLQEFEKILTNLDFDRVSSYEEIEVPLDLLFEYGKNSVAMYALGGDKIPSPTYRITDLEEVSLTVGKISHDRIKFLLRKPEYDSPVQIWVKNTGDANESLYDRIIYRFMNSEYIKVKRAYSLNYIAVFEEIGT